MKTAVRALLATIILVVLTGLVYPVAMTAFAQLVLRNEANGSLVERDGVEVGSSRIGQSWKGPEWFYGRPSAVKNDASTSSGSNLGPTSGPLEQQIQKRIEAVLALEAPYNPGLTAADIPVDLLTASASGLDPDISLAAAALQAPRIAAVRHLSVEQVHQLIDDQSSGKTLGFLGEPRVNVLELNLALDSAAPSS